jgi:hypothetical protein
MDRYEDGRSAEGLGGLPEDLRAEAADQLDQPPFPTPRPLSAGNKVGRVLAGLLGCGMLLLAMLAMPWIRVAFEMDAGSALGLLLLTIALLIGGVLLVVVAARR